MLLFISAVKKPCHIIVVKILSLIKSVAHCFLGRAKQSCPCESNCHRHCPCGRKQTPSHPCASVLPACQSNAAHAVVTNGLDAAKRPCVLLRCLRKRREVVLRVDHGSDLTRPLLYPLPLRALPLSLIKMFFPLMNAPLFHECTPWPVHGGREVLSLNLSSLFCLLKTFLFHSMR